MGARAFLPSLQREKALTSVHPSWKWSQGAHVCSGAAEAGGEQKEILSQLLWDLLWGMAGPRG